jgi:hypothetical protein
MGEPRIAAKEPSVLTLEAGTYYWCKCDDRGISHFVTEPMKERGSSRLSSR